MSDDDDFEAHEPGEEREYQVIFTGTATMYVTVTATHPTFAVNKAERRLSSQLCIHCSNPFGENVEREWPEHMEVDEVTVDGQKCDPGDY